MKFLVVDSGAFIKNSPVHEYAENIYTVEGVVNEIRDAATRQRLQFLPYKLHIKEPSQESYKYVLEFSKKTGDFSSLSVTDLKVIALTYQLEKENVGTEHLNSEPTSKISRYPFKNNQQICGFYTPKEKPEENETKLSDNVDTLQNEDEISHNITTNEEALSKDVLCTTEEQTTVVTVEEVEARKENIVNDDSDQDLDEEAASDSDDDVWITPSNLSEIQKKMGEFTFDENVDITVGCVTADFAVQNTLLQMGLHIISVNGMLIKRTNVFILRCHSCYKLTNDVTKKFCPSCGNKTLKRVSVTVNEDGSKNVHINFKRPINIRGTRYSLPMPRGGKHSKDPVLCGDQRTAQNRPSKMALRKIDALSPDYEALSSPFVVNDVYSRAANLGYRSMKERNCRRNPNASSKFTGNKKKK